MATHLLITNASAGTADEAAIARVTEVLSAHGGVRVVSTSSPEELDEVLAGDPTTRVVVAGGDGSLHAVVAALHRRDELADRVLGLVPLGTGNDFARGTGVPLETDEAAQLLVTASPRPVDLLVDDTGAVVVNNVHLGMGALASRKGADFKTRLGGLGVGRLNLGRLGYPLGVAATAFGASGLRLRVEVDGAAVPTHGHQVLMVAVGNGSQVGGGTEVTPLADPADARLDVMVSLAESGRAKARYAADLVLGRVHRNDDVLYLRGREVRVTGEGFWLSADGEISGPVTSRSWRLVPGALTMLLPD